MLISAFDTKGIEALVEEFENNNSFEFPESYKAFLLRYNGGRTPDSGFSIGDITSDIRGFYGLGAADEFLNYSFYVQTYKLDEFIEDGFIPIADNVFSDDIVMGIQEDNKGKIYMRYSDIAKQYVLLCEDFSSFVRQCASSPQEVLSISERKKMLKANGGKNMIDQLLPTWKAEIELYGNLALQELSL